jgi:SAM-dependent methyltransferase
VRWLPPWFNSPVSGTSSHNASPPRIDEHDPVSLADYLGSFEWELQDVATFRAVIEGGLNLWRTVIEYTPNPAQRGRLLELGSPPFDMTLLLQKFRNYDLSLTGFASDSRPEIVKELESPRFGERYTFRCACFDVEHDPFPYDDNSFDVVNWCEVIEHLTENPVHTLSEIHRVLKPEGELVLSTPNACRSDSIANFLYGLNIYDRYHLGSLLKGSRHSREYTYQELQELVEGSGFQIERMEDIDICPPFGLRRRAMRAVMNNVVSRITGGHYRDHLFVRARKTQRPFRWHFPTKLFAEQHLAYYLAPTRNVVMGENDELHTTTGWGELATGPQGRTMRRSEDVGNVYLLSEGRETQVTATVSRGKGQAQTWHSNAGKLVWLGKADFDAPADRWIDVVVPLSNEYEPGNPIHVRFDAPGGVDVHAVAVG